MNKSFHRELDKNARDQVKLAVKSNACHPKAASSTQFANEMKIYLSQFEQEAQVKWKQWFSSFITVDFQLTL